MESLTFSLIVPTLNRVEELRILFVSLQAQTRQDFEVLIVDQNEDERISPLIGEFSGFLKLVHIRQLEKGASHARNAGLRRSAGAIVTFPDDDCEYPPDLLEKVYKSFESHPELDGLTVASRDKNDKGSVARLSSREGRITRFNILQKLIEFTIFVKASRLQNFFFDEDLGVGAKTPWWSDEGPDFVLRLINQGAVFIYFPDIIIFHPNPTLVYNEKAWTRSYRYGLGRGRYLRKHHYPLWFVFYVWGLYVAGMATGLIQLSGGKIRYYYSGLKGRIEGYVKQ